jgi:glutamate racemase
MSFSYNNIQKSEQTIGIIAGTQTDTRFGLEYLESRGYKGIGFSVSSNPQAQTQLQVLDSEALTKLTINSLKEIAQAGADCAMIYCNSLSGAINLEQVRDKSPIPFVTPLEVYEKLTTRYRNFGLLAANCQSCANIERIILKCNSTAKVIGIGNLQIVEDIEANIGADRIIHLHALPELANALVKSGVQILILGCTHFDYFYHELKSQVEGIKVFLPSEQMFETLKSIHFK